MSDYRFQIFIDGGLIRAEWDSSTVVARSTDWIELHDDPLCLETVFTLEEWLRRDEYLLSMETAQTRDLIVPTTLHVLGRQLFQLMLDNEVGRLLVEAVAEVPDGRTLEVHIVFGLDTDRYATLPWELLKAPVPGGDGYFLATETKLVLTRHLSGETAREIRVQDQQVHALLINAVPDNDAFRYERKVVEELDETLTDHDEWVHLTTQHRWDEAKIKERLTQGAGIDIVHIVGVCRPGAPVPSLLLPEGDGTRWVNADVLVRLLTENAERIPQLVVLHLCERQPSADGSPFGDSFERLAPLLLRAKVPAVLAMQYPMERSKAFHFLHHFYHELSENNFIGIAVQSARSKMLDRAPRRRIFGSPVLYLQSIDCRLTGRPIVAATTKAPLPPLAAPAGVQQMVLDIIELRAYKLPAALREELTEWARSTPWPDDPEKARLVVFERSHDDSRRETLPVYAALVRALQDEG